MYLHAFGPAIPPSVREAFGTLPSSRSLSSCQLSWASAYLELDYYRARALMLNGRKRYFSQSHYFTTLPSIVKGAD